MKRTKQTNTFFRITALLLIWTLVVPGYVWATEGKSTSFSTLAPQVNIQVETFRDAYSIYMSLAKLNQTVTKLPNNVAKDITQTAFPIKDFSKAVFPGMKIFDFGISFFQVRKAPGKDAFSLLKRYTDVDGQEIKYVELPVVPMLIKALRESKGIPAIHKKLSFELARLLLAMFDMTGDPGMLGRDFYMYIFRNVHHYREYKELIPVIGMAIALAAGIDPAIKSHLMIPARSFHGYNDIQRNMNRLAGFLRDEQIALDFVSLLEEQEDDSEAQEDDLEDQDDDSHEPWDIDYQVAIIDSIGAIFYKSPAIRDEVVERLNKLIAQESLHAVVKNRLNNTINIITSGQDGISEANYEQLMQEFKEYASTTSVNNSSLIRILRDMELKITQDDKGDFEKEAEEAYFADIKKYRDPIDDFDLHLARIIGSLTDLNDHEVFFNQVLELVRIDYDKSIELLLGDKDAIATTKGLKGFEPLPVIPARWDGEMCLQFLRQFYERWVDRNYDSNIRYDVDMRNLISPLEAFLAGDYDPSGVTQELIDFLRTHKGIINTKNVDEFLKHIEPVLDLNERTEIALRSIRHDAIKYFDLKDSLEIYINKFPKSEAIDKAMEMLESEEGLLAEIYRRIGQRRDKPEYVNKPLITFSEARQIRNNLQIINNAAQKIAAQGIVRQKSLFAYDVFKMVPEVFLDFIFNSLKFESVTAGQVMTDFITLLSGSPSNVYSFISEIDWDSHKLTVKGEKTTMEFDISQIFEEIDYGYPIRFEVNGLDIPIDANFVYLQEIIRLGVINSMQVASEKFEEEHKMGVAQAKKQG
ncbi:MAG: hypothetical protein KKB82_09145, partial [Candidatus Omnitrophica bacterium]|nr:hypothetical protein [Candidatus Omnitrophota bacterium]